MLFNSLSFRDLIQGESDEVATVPEASCISAIRAMICSMSDDIAGLGCYATALRENSSALRQTHLEPTLQNP